MSTSLDLSEGGKHVRTALGWNVRIYATDGSEEHPIHGAYQAPKSGWCGMIWSASGVAFGVSDGSHRRKVDDYQLVPYVPEPAEGEVWWCFPAKAGVTPVALVPVEFRSYRAGEQYIGPGEDVRLAESDAPATEAWRLILHRVTPRLSTETGA